MLTTVIAAFASTAATQQPRSPANNDAIVAPKNEFALQEI
jgi:hypothetical protein